MNRLIQLLTPGSTRGVCSWPLNDLSFHAAQLFDRLIQESLKLLAFVTVPPAHFFTMAMAVIQECGFEHLPSSPDLAPLRLTPP